MTELGESTDPRVLVPGKAAGIDQAAARWRRLAGVAEQTAASLKAVGVPEGWAGDAADAFESRVASVGRRWDRVSDALTAAASALEGFSSTLLWAQGQAEVSVDMWERAARQSAEGVAAPMVGLGLRAEASPSSPVDPGGPLRQRAVELLGDARERLAAAGDSAASAIDAAAAEPDLDAEVWVALGASAGTPQEALAVLRGLDADDLASMLRVRPDLADTLSRAEAADVAAWWKGLDDSQQGALIAAIPAVVGNLNGVAYVARDRANREWLDDQLADARKALTAAEKSLPWWQIDNPELVGAHDAKLIAAREQFEALTNIDAALTGPDGGTERSLISLSADTPPLAGISIGDVDVADNITYAVPGMGTTTSEGIGAWTQAAENIERWQSQYAPDAVHAVVAWVGYETPPVPGNGGFQVLGTEHAEAGATKLSRALGGIDATRPDAHVNVVAHSYGTTTSSIALTQSGTQVDSFVSLGSAGLPPNIDRASDLNAAEVFAGQARDVVAIDPAGGDQWAWTGRLSPEHPVNPIEDDFGAHAFGTDGNGTGARVTDHSPLTPTGNGYLDRGTESLRNVAFATTGQGDRVSAYVPPEPTPFQEAILDGATHGYW